MWAKQRTTTKKKWQKTRRLIDTPPNLVKKGFSLLSVRYPTFLLVGEMKEVWPFESCYLVKMP